MPSRRITAILVSLGTLVPGGTAFCGPEPAAPDSVDAFVSPASPLSLPRILWEVAVYPLERFTVYAEQTNLQARFERWFTNASGTFGLRPQVQLGGETGTGGGFALFAAPPSRGVLELHGVYSGGRGQLARGTYDLPAAGPAGRHSVRLSGDFLNTHHREARINGAVRSDPSRSFSIRRADGDLRLGWRAVAGRFEPVSRNVRLEAIGGYAFRHFRPRDGSDAPLDDVGSTPEARLLRGLDNPIQYVRAGARIVLDSRDYAQPFDAPPHVLYGHFPGEDHLVLDGRYHPLRNTAYPENGALLLAEAHAASGSDDVRFLKSVVEVQGYATLWARERVLAVRARFEKLHPIGSGIVPFPDLDTLGGSQDLRGYRRGHFRGLGTLTFNVEYRYPIWDTWNAFLFWDEGMVFDGLDEVTLDRFRTAWGGGVTFRTARHLVAKIQVGHSAVETALVGLVLGQEF